MYVCIFISQCQNGAGSLNVMWSLIGWAHPLIDPCNGHCSAVEYLCQEAKKWSSFSHKINLNTLSNFPRSLFLSLSLGNMLFPDYRFKIEFIETLFKCGYWLRCWCADRHRSNYSRHYVDTIQWQSQYKERLKHHITGPLCGESTSQSTSNVEHVFMSSWTWWNINCVWDCHQKSSSFCYCHSPIHHCLHKTW